MSGCTVQSNSCDYTQSNQSDLSQQKPERSTLRARKTNNREQQQQQGVGVQDKQMKTQQCKIVTGVNQSHRGSSHFPRPGKMEFGGDGVISTKSFSYHGVVMIDQKNKGGGFDWMENWRMEMEGTWEFG